MHKFKRYFSAFFARYSYRSVALAAGMIAVLFFTFYSLSFSASPVMLFSDGFESDNFSKWTAADDSGKGAWDVKGGDMHNSVSKKKAEIKGDKDAIGDKIIREATSTAGYEFITIGYWYKIDDQLESNDHVYLEWTSDGINWNIATDTTNIDKGSWTQATSTLPSGAANQSGFQFRFRANLDAGHDVFWLDDVLLTGEPIPAPASLTIVKDADPNDSQDFSFTSNFGQSFNLDDDSDSTLSDRATFSLAAGAYSVTETVPAGWDLTNTSCSDGSSVSAIQLTSGESVTCTFTNTKRGHLVVSKTTDPLNDPTPFTISLSGTGTIIGTTTRILTATSSVDYEVVPGTFSIGESVPAGWQLNGNACVNVQVNAGATVPCAITNQKLGKIIIEKHTDPINSSKRFSFSPSYAQSFTLADGETNTSGFLAPGAYSVSETVPAGWDFINSSCSDGSDPDAIALAPGKTITCSFTNRQRGSIKITKISDPVDKTQFAFDLAGPTSGSVSLASGYSFIFTDLVPGDYTLSETPPQGWSGSSRIACSDGTADSIPLAAGDIVTCDINNTEFGSISGRKFLDQNADGNGTGEPGLAGWTIALHDEDEEGDEDEEEIATAETGDDGSYLFANLLPGTYRVCETLKTDWFQSYPLTDADASCPDETNGYLIPLAAGKTVVGMDFGNYQRVSISGEKFNDHNGNGFKDEGEPGLANWTINLFDGSGTSTTATDENGAFQFSGLAPGKTYTVSEELNLGWTQITPNPASIKPSSGESITGILFGNFSYVTIRGIKWWDKNSDGIRQQDGTAAEPGLPDWPVSLTRVQRQVPVEGPTQTIETEIVALSLTGADGSFALQADRPGNYRVREGTQNGWERTYPQDSFFDIFVDVGGSEVTTDTHAVPLNFGNIFFVDIFGGKFAPASGASTSTPSAAVRGPTTISVQVTGGTSTIAFADGTTITRSDGGNIDLTSLTAVEATSSISGLGQGVVLDGALQWGIANLGLGFSPPITVSIFVGNEHNGETLNVLRSTSGSGDWTSDGITPPATCLVASGLCAFTATKASFYAGTHTPPSSSGNQGSGSSGGSAPGANGPIFSSEPTPFSFTNSGSSSGSTAVSPGEVNTPREIVLGVSSAGRGVESTESSAAAPTENTIASPAENGANMPNANVSQQTKSVEEHPQTPQPQRRSLLASILTFGTGKNSFGIYLILVILAFIAAGYIFWRRFWRVR